MYVEELLLCLSLFFKNHFNWSVLREGYYCLYKIGLNVTSLRILAVSRKSKVEAC